MDYLLNNEEDMNELRELWFDRCWTTIEIAEWFGTSKTNVLNHIYKIKVEKEEFREKEAEFAEFLKVFKHRKPLKRLFEKRLKRLEEAYERTRRNRKNNERIRKSSLMGLRIR